MFRRSIIFLAIIATLATLPIAASAGDAPKFRQIHMMNDRQGWAVVVVPDPQEGPMQGQSYAGMLGYIVHTEDGGKTWKNVTPKLTYTGIAGYGCDCTDNAIANVFFLDATHAWIATDDASIRGNQAFYGIGVWRTSNAGQSWQNSPDGMNAPKVIAASFTDTLHGWLLLGNVSVNGGEEPVMLFRTNDGGMDWDLIADDGVNEHYDARAPESTGPISKTDGLTLQFHTDMVFESPLSGWITVTDIDPGNGALLHTLDGGKTWKRVNVSSAPDALQNCRPYLLQAHKRNEITFVAYCDSPILYRTSDDGKTWQSVNLPDYIYDLSMTSITNGWLVGCQTSQASTPCYDDPAGTLTVNQTTDGGKTWTKTGSLPESIHPLADEDIPFSSFDFINDHSGWVIDLAGSLLTTSDAGKTWITLPPKIEGLPSDAMATSTAP